MHANLRTNGVAALAVLLLALPGCGGGMGSLGTLGDILAGAAGAAGAGGAQQGQVTAEIQQVDPQRQLIQFRTQQGQTGTARYDQNTQVVYQQQQHPVTALERGDVVVMRVQQDSQGNLYVARVDVQQSVQERTGQGAVGTSGSLQQYAGQVRQIDHSRGVFQLQTQYGAVTVSLPYNPGDATVQYFNRLRAGSSVRLEGRALGDGRVELYRFL